MTRLPALFACRVGHCLVTVSIFPLSGEGLGCCVPSVRALCSLWESVLGAAGYGQPVPSALHPAGTRSPAAGLDKACPVRWTQHRFCLRNINT